MDDNDAQLVRRCLAGEQAAFERLHADHAGRVLAYFARSGFGRHIAEDMTQETFIRAFRSLHTFDANRGRFRPWLATIARNVARKHWGKRKQPENFAPELAEEMFAAVDNPGPDAAEAEEIDAVRRCVDSLPGETAAPRRGEGDLLAPCRRICRNTGCRTSPQKAGTHTTATRIIQLHSCRRRSILIFNADKAKETEDSWPNLQQY